MLKTKTKKKNIIFQRSINIDFLLLPLLLIFFLLCPIYIQIPLLLVINYLFALYFSVFAFCCERTLCLTKISKNLTIFFFIRVLTIILLSSLTINSIFVEKLSLNISFKESLIFVFLVLPFIAVLFYLSKRFIDKINLDKDDKQQTLYKNELINNLLLLKTEYIIVFLMFIFNIINVYIFGYLNNNSGIEGIFDAIAISVFITIITMVPVVMMLCSFDVIVYRYFNKKDDFFDNFTFTNLSNNTITFIFICLIIFSIIFHLYLLLLLLLTLIVAFKLFSFHMNKDIHKYYYDESIKSQTVKKLDKVIKALKDSNIQKQIDILKQRLDTFEDQDIKVILQGLEVALDGLEIKDLIIQTEKIISSTNDPKVKDYVVNLKQVLEKYNDPKDKINIVYIIEDLDSYERQDTYKLIEEIEKALGDLDFEELFNQIEIVIETIKDLEIKKNLEEINQNFEAFYYSWGLNQLFEMQDNYSNSVDPEIRKFFVTFNRVFKELETGDLLNYLEKIVEFNGDLEIKKQLEIIVGDFKIKNNFEAMKKLLKISVYNVIIYKDPEVKSLLNLFNNFVYLRNVQGLMNGIDFVLENNKDSAYIEDIEQLKQLLEMYKI